MPTIHFHNSDGRREWPKQGVAAPRTEAQKAALDKLYKNVPELPQAPAKRATISDIDQRQQQAREFAARPRLRYIPHPDRPGGRIEPIAAPAFNERTSWHEAGHAVLQLHRGCDSVDAIVRADGSGETAPVGAVKSQCCRDDIVLAIATTTAGRIAEVIKFGTADPWREHAEHGTDDNKLQILPLLMPDENADKLRAEGTAFAEKVLRERWADVEMIAAKLAKNGKVSVQEKTVRKISLPLQTRSGSASFDDAAGTIEVIWGTGQRVLRSGWDGKFYEDLPAENADLSFLNSGRAPFLDTHASQGTENVYGVVQANSAFVKDGKGFATIRLGSNAPRDDLRSGVLASLSIGYTISKMTRQPAGDDDIPVMRIDAYRIKEISLCPLGADEGAMVRKFEAEIR